MSDVPLRLPEIQGKFQQLYSEAMAMKNVRACCWRADVGTEVSGAQDPAGKWDDSRD